MPFIDLLPLAGVIQLHQLDPVGIIQLCHGRIVEGDVTIFANTQATEIDRCLFEQLGVSITFIEWQKRIALEVMKGLGLDQTFHTLLPCQVEAPLADESVDEFIAG